MTGKKQEYFNLLYQFSTCSFMCVTTPNFAKYWLDLHPILVKQEKISSYNMTMDVTTKQIELSAMLAFDRWTIGF